ncbi:unannotated protein [freshwater metagenome]|uniref:Unannotated protein n=1 Tax=freshwater metagenome TaxID=449393 RepID=A0A6J7H838_9ZZZZ
MRVVAVAGGRPCRPGSPGETPRRGGRPPRPVAPIGHVPPTRRSVPPVAPPCDDRGMKHPRRWTPFERVAVGMGAGWAVVIAAIVLHVVGVLG